MGNKSKGLHTGYQQEQKIKNIDKILELIHKRRGISRISAAKELEIDRSTVTNIVPELLKIGIINEELQIPTGKGGRPPSILRINSNFGCALGISIHLRGYHAAVLNLDGEVLEVFQEPLPFPYKEFGLNCRSILCKIESDIKKRIVPIIGAVIALSGTINPEKNIIERSFVFQLENYNFQKEISQHFSYPVFVENDANACAWGELFPPWNKNYSSFLYLLARTNAYNKDTNIDSGMAIGIGIVADGRIIYGANNQAGELRSVHWRKINGSENQVSIPLDRLSLIDTDEDVFREFIIEILDSLSPVVSVIDPDAIIFGGDTKNRIAIIKEILKNTDNGNFLAVEHKRYSIASPDKGTEEICAGAACLFLFQLFKQSIDYPLRKKMATWEKSFNLKRSLL
ncbi:MAG: ROK family transcriptional regulator [Labilibaculum sp.]|nr:ROK family transcriptional regulator [Labilibaculum sp.]MBI9060312.1 ROK family transcriptional regulator [Labilibaculum sp.]